MQNIKMWAAIKPLANIKMYQGVRVLTDGVIHRETKKIKKRLKTHLYNYAFMFIILITSNYCVSMLKYIQKNMFFINIFN